MIEPEEQFPPVRKPTHQLFTRENARAFALKGLEVKRANKLAMQQRLKEAEEQESMLVQAGVQAMIEARPGYQAERLARVRKQLDRIDEMLLDEDDPGKLHRLAMAADKLNEQEAQLSMRGRPAPVKQSSKVRISQISPE